MTIVRNRGLGSWIARRARMAPDAVAVISGDEVVRYDALAVRVSRVGRALHGLGIKRGDRVGYIGPNTVAFLETLFGAGTIGAVFVPLNFRATEAAIRHALRDSRCAALIFHPMVADLVARLRADVPVGAYLVIGDDQAGAASYDRLVGRQPNDLLDERVEPDELCVLSYTSGTTGDPKGVMLTHDNITWNVFNGLSCVDFSRDDVLLASAPMYRVGGFTAALLPVLYKGGTIVIMETFDAARALAVIAAHGVTIVFGAPSYFAAMIDSPELPRADVSSLRFCLCGGSPVPVAMIRRWLELGVPFLQGYGLTEGATRVLMLDRSDMLRKVGSAGRQPMFADVRVIRPDHSDVAPGEIGEIVVKGPNVCRGYWSLPEATARAISDDGWLHTGDAARVDDEGYVYLLDRLSDSITIDRETLYPTEVEDPLKGHPAVADCAVVGLPDGAGLALFVVPRPGATCTVDDVLEFATAHLSPARTPRVVRFIDRVPRNANDKVLRRELGAMLEPAPQPASAPGARDGVPDLTRDQPRAG